MLPIDIIIEVSGTLDTSLKSIVGLLSFVFDHHNDFKIQFNSVKYIHGKEHRLRQG